MNKIKEVDNVTGYVLMRDMKKSQIGLIDDNSFNDYNGNLVISTGRCLVVSIIDGCHWRWDDYVSGPTLRVRILPAGTDITLTVNC